MNKYIDAEKLKKYIENKRNVVCDGLDWDDMDDSQRYAAEHIDDILDFIESLQQEQPEVDLEDIIRVEFGTRAKVEDGRRYVKLDWDNFSILARHFYSLGLNARKEE